MWTHDKVEASYAAVVESSVHGVHFWHTDVLDRATEHIPWPVSLSSAVPPT